MRTAGLRGTPNDMAKFMAGTFAAEQQEQRRLVSQAQRGELEDSAAEGVQGSPVAAAAAAEAAANYVVDEERTTVELLPPLGEDSQRNWQADPDEDDHDPLFDLKTTAMPPKPSPTSQANTEPRGVPALRSGQIPTIYYVFAILSVVLIVLIAWLIAR